MNPASQRLNLHRTTSGAGPVLLMLHGVTRCGADWEPLLPALVEHWKVIALDQRGHGTSPRAGSYLVTDYIAAARLLGVSQPRLPHLMGLLLLAPQIQEAILTGTITPGATRR